MRNLKNIYLIVITALISINTTAQDGTLARANYTVGFQLSNTDYLSKPTFRGFGFALGHMFETGFSVNIEANWSNFYQYEKKRTYYFEGGAITTDLYKYRHQIPVVLALNYTFLKDRFFPVKPYLGFGIGLNYIRDKIYYSTYEINEHNAGFLIQPKLGFSLALDEDGDVNAFVEGALNYSSNESSDFQYRRNTSCNLALGVYLIFE
jgi:hypothetical protein